jgi:poly-gamma-glutamate synthesis protein (capsule biosynthesis protein)
MAEAPAIISVYGGTRVLVYAVGAGSSGIPSDWAATVGRPGLAFMSVPSIAVAERLCGRVRSTKRAGDLVVVSVHWGPNWGYDVEPREIEFAQALIDRGGADLVHGHSSHHPKAIEVYRGKLILWGCGDFINDYEGISGHESFRSHLGVMYLPTIDGRSGALESLELVVMRRERFRLKLAGANDTLWLCAVLDRESRRFGVSVGVEAESRLRVRW